MLVETGTLVVIVTSILVTLLLVVFVHKKYKNVNVDGKHNFIDELNLTEQHWFISEDKNPATITVLLDLESCAELETIRTGLESRLMDATVSSTPQSKLSRLVSVVKQKKSKFLFIPCQTFSINNHVRQLEKPIRRDDIHLEIDRLVTTPLNRKLPLWLCTLIHYEDGLGSAIVFQLHHSVADGVSLVRLLMEKIMDNPQPFTLPYKPRSVPIWSRCRQAFLLPYDALKMIVIDTLRCNDKNSFKRNALTGEKVTSMTAAIPLTLLKSVKLPPQLPTSQDSTASTSSATTVNDVMMTAIFSALGQVNQTDTNSARVVFPIYLASIPKEITLNNKYSVILLRLPLLNGNPTDDALLDDLQVFGSILQDAKRSNIPFLTALLERLLMALPGLFNAQFVEKAINRSTGVMSNVIGPPAPISVFGHRVSNIMPFLPNKGNLTVAVFMMSYNGNMRVSLTMDKALDLDAKYVTDLISKRINQMIDASLKQRSPASLPKTLHSDAKTAATSNC